MPLPCKLIRSQLLNRKRPSRIRSFHSSANQNQTPSVRCVSIVAGSWTGVTSTNQQAGCGFQILAVCLSTCLAVVFRWISAGMCPTTSKSSGQGSCASSKEKGERCSTASKHLAQSGNVMSIFPTNALSAEWTWCFITAYAVRLTSTSVVRRPESMQTLNGGQIPSLF